VTVHDHQASDVSEAAVSDYAREVLGIDPSGVSDRIAGWIQSTVGSDLRRRGVVLGLSGGVDSSVCAALAVRALGRERVFGLLLPERESKDDSTRLGAVVAEWLGIDHLTVDISSALDAVGAYRLRDEAIRSVVPGYGPGWKCKIAIAHGGFGGLNFFNLVVQAPNGDVTDQRLRAKPYLEIVAATNFKQRLRKVTEYYHADRLGYAVIGTPNRLEYDQGFFVKNGDGAADLKPIAHLYKSQVYLLADHLGVPDEIRVAQPTTDTYSMVQSQDEFYFALPYAKMDLALWAFDHSIPPAEVAVELGLTEAQAADAYQDIERKRDATRYLHRPPVLVEEAHALGS
jgi:NAD+ synthase